MDKDILKRIEGHLDTAEEMQQAFLLTVLESVPDWLPQDTRTQLNQALQRFVDPHCTDEPIPAETIIRSMDTFDADMLFPGVMRDNVQYLQDISMLVTVRSAIQLGEMEGLPLLLGKGAVTTVGKQAVSETQRKKAKQPRRERPLKQFLRVILNDAKTHNLEGVLEILRDPVLAEDLTVGRAPYISKEVDDENRKILFEEVKTEKEVWISFKAIQNALSGIKR